MSSSEESGQDFLDAALRQVARLLSQQAMSSNGKDSADYDDDRSKTTPTLDDSLGDAMPVLHSANPLNPTHLLLCVIPFDLSPRRLTRMRRLECAGWNGSEIEIRIQIRIELGFCGTLLRAQYLRRAN